MLDDFKIKNNIERAFKAMGPIEFFETWRKLTDILGEEFPVIYNKTEFDELTDRMPEEELTKLVKKWPFFDENDMFFLIYDGQLYNDTHLDFYFEPIQRFRNQVCETLAEKKLTLGSKRLEKAFTEDFDKDMTTLDTDLRLFFEEKFDEKNEWKKYVEGCKKVGYDGKYGPIPMEDRDYWLGEVSDSFNFQDDWFYFNKEKRQFFSFTDWDYDIGNEIGLYKYHRELMDYIIRTGDDLGFTGVREILDKNKKYGYVPRKDGNLYYY